VATENILVFKKFNRKNNSISDLELKIKELSKNEKSGVIGHILKLRVSDLQSTKKLVEEFQSKSKEALSKELDESQL
jgi:hypothetical protein